MTLNLLTLVATNIRSKFGPACDASQCPDGPSPAPVHCLDRPQARRATEILQAFTGDSGGLKDLQKCD